MNTKEIILEFLALFSLLFFEIWNVKRARRRGAIYWGLFIVPRRIWPKDFETLIVLNTVIIAIAALMIIWRLFTLVIG